MWRHPAGARASAPAASGGRADRCCGAVQRLRSVCACSEGAGRPERRLSAAAAPHSAESSAAVGRGRPAPPSRAPQASRGGRRAPAWAYLCCSHAVQGDPLCGPSRLGVKAAEGARGKQTSTAGDFCARQSARPAGKSLPPRPPSQPSLLRHGLRCRSRSQGDNAPRLRAPRLPCSQAGHFRAPFRRRQGRDRGRPHHLRGEPRVHRAHWHGRGRGAGPAAGRGPQARGRAGRPSERQGDPRRRRHQGRGDQHPHSLRCCARGSCPGGSGRRRVRG